MNHLFYLIVLIENPLDLKIRIYFFDFLHFTGVLVSAFIKKSPNSARNYSDFLHSWENVGFDFEII